MKLPLYKYALLKVDVPKYNMFLGDVVLVVDFLEGTSEIPNAYIVEAFNALGETLGVFTVTADKLAPLAKNNVLHIRNYSKKKYKEIA